MDTLKCAVLTSIVLRLTVNAQMHEVKQGAIQKNDKDCNKLAKDPYFEVDLVIEKPWRVYYTWCVKLDTKCLDFVFRNATRAIIHRVRSDMFDYMEQQPYWDSAALLFTSEAARQEILLFPAQGVAGGFTGVPNLIRHGDITPMRNGVPLLKLQFKLVHNGKFLVIMDCRAGITSLATRADHPPYKSEIAAVVAELNLGDGFPACTKENNKHDFFVK